MQVKACRKRNAKIVLLKSRFKWQQLYEC